MDGAAQYNTSACSTANLTAPSSSRACNVEACATVHWRADSPWQPCSSPCMNASESLERTTRAEPTCMYNTAVIASTIRTNKGLSKPETSHACNRALCSYDRFAWLTSRWPACSAPTGRDVGLMSRTTVTCVDFSGTAVADSACVNSGTRPLSLGVGYTGVPRACTTDADCASEHAVCDGRT